MPHFQCLWCRVPGRLEMRLPRPVPAVVTPLGSPGVQAKCIICGMLQGPTNLYHVVCSPNLPNFPSFGKKTSGARRNQIETMDAKRGARILLARSRLFFRSAKRIRRSQPRGRSGRRRGRSDSRCLRTKTKLLQCERVDFARWIQCVRRLEFLHRCGRIIVPFAVWRSQKRSIFRESELNFGDSIHSGSFLPGLLARFVRNFFLRRRASVAVGGTSGFFLRGTLSAFGSLAETRQHTQSCQRGD